MTLTFHGSDTIEMQENANSLRVVTRQIMKAFYIYKYCLDLDDFV